MEETLSADKQGDFIAVVDKAKKDPEVMKKYFSVTYEPNSPTKLSSSNGPCGTITNM